MDTSFTIVPGDPSSPVVLHLPHSSTVIPSWVRERIVLDDDALGVELRAMTDAHTDLVAAAASRASTVRPWLMVNRLSRLVIDPERFTDPDLEEMESVGMGAVYTATHRRGVLRPDDVEHREELLARYFSPYAEALADLVHQRLDVTGSALIIDVHSYPRDRLPYELHGDLVRPQVCLGVDERHTPDALVARAREAFGAWDTAVNEPFIGTYVPTRHYGTDLRVASIMIEIRRDQYLDPDGRPRLDAVDALGTAVAALGR